MSDPHFEEVPVDAEFKQKINVEFLTLKQIDRCNNAAFEGDEAKFSNAVESLLAMLPKENRMRIENERNKEEYMEKVEQPVYQYSCGKPMGTPENPIYRNTPSDWNYDGGEPILVSPTVEEVENIDYQKLYKMILAELQDVGVTWKIEPRGNVGKKIAPPTTPLLKLKDGSYVRVLVEKGVDAVKDLPAIQNPTNDDDEEEDEDEEDSVEEQEDDVYSDLNATENPLLLDKEEPVDVSKIKIKVKEKEKTSVPDEVFLQRALEIKRQKQKEEDDLRSAENEKILKLAKEQEAQAEQRAREDEARIKAEMNSRVEKVIAPKPPIVELTELKENVPVRPKAPNVDTSGVFDDVLGMSLETKKEKKKKVKMDDETN